MAKFCPHCGAKLNDNASFCSSCGTKLMISPHTSEAPSNQYHTVIYKISRWKTCFSVKKVG